MSLIDRVSNACHGIHSNLLRVTLHPDDWNAYVIELGELVATLPLMSTFAHGGTGRVIIAVPGNVGRGAAKAEARDRLKKTDTRYTNERFLAGNVATEA